MGAGRKKGKNERNTKRERERERERERGRGREREQTQTEKRRVMTKLVLFIMNIRPQNIRPLSITRHRKLGKKFS